MVNFSLPEIRFAWGCRFYLPAGKKTGGEKALAFTHLGCPAASGFSLKHLAAGNISPNSCWRPVCGFSHPQIFTDRRGIDLPSIFDTQDPSTAAICSPAASRARRGWDSGDHADAGGRGGRKSWLRLLKAGRGDAASRYRQLKAVEGVRGRCRPFINEGCASVFQQHRHEPEARCRNRWQNLPSWPCLEVSRSMPVRYSIQQGRHLQRWRERRNLDPAKAPAKMPRFAACTGVILHLRQKPRPDTIRYLSRL